MHGRPRKAPTAEEEEASAVKGARLHSLQQQFLEFHRAKTYTKEALEVSAKLVEVNPEYYTAWNYRKLAVEHLLKDQSDSDSIKSILDEELRVVENALRSNFKSYGAWHHRKWVLIKGHSSTDHELLLLGKFQKVDARNFHAWNYRRFIAALKNIPDEAELQYTQDMIYNNFSNYSAWHNRSVLLSNLLKKKAEGYHPKEKFLTEEYDFVRNALFVEPNDQSGWFYHLWLLDQTLKVEHLFVSSWPPNGLDICVSDHMLLNSYVSSSSSLSNSSFPLILCFSEPVVGISSTTVTVECEFNTDCNFVWTPISGSKSGPASKWLTYLKFPTKDMLPSRHYQVKISIAQFEGIVSSTGVCFSNPPDIAFRVCVKSHKSDHEREQESQRIHWLEANFFENVFHAEELDFIKSFHQLRISEDNKMEANKMNVEIITKEISHCRELLLADQCKIGKLTLARLLMARDALLSASSCANDQRVFSYKEILELYNDLMKFDPPHFQYYDNEHSLFFLKQELNNEESLLRYCYQYRDSTLPRAKSFLTLRLNGLSLSLIGCMEQVLWVQMLDLSDNVLRSIEGLEAMQLLCCLNLSKNKFSSFSALEPLRLLKSLKVLDISYNEIGAHPIDTRRYLCASPLSHSVGSDWNFEKFGISSLEMANYWDAFSVFSCLNLTQLDVLGNPVAGKTFESFLCKVLPSLKWLDGEKFG